MTEEYWADYKKKKDLQQSNYIWRGVENWERMKKIESQHPDKLYAICRTDNNYWRHYRASPKLGIDELSMMICKDVGCDLSYCQQLFAKPRPGMQINNCDAQFNQFRECVVREKKVFRSLFGNIDTKENPNAIPDYLDKHFKEKEARRKERKMMGADTDDLKAKMEEF